VLKQTLVENDATVARTCAVPVLLATYGWAVPWKDSPGVVGEEAPSCRCRSGSRPCAEVAEACHSLPASGVALKEENQQLVGWEDTEETHAERICWWRGPSAIADALDSGSTDSLNVKGKMGGWVASGWKSGVER
jgi:hypothetical protein